MENNGNSLGREIGELSSQLKNLDAQKEQKYQEISKINSELDGLLKQASELKANKQDLALQIKKKKEDRDKLNSEVGTLAQKLKALQVPKLQILRVRITRRLDPESPEYLQRQIDMLSNKLQTEVIAYKKEQALMRLINEFKAKLKEKSAETNKLRAYFDAKDALRKSKMIADNLHKEIQTVATNNSQIFVRLTDISKKIAEMRTKKLLLRGEIGGLKIQLGKINQDLGTKLTSWSTARSSANSERRVNTDKVVKEKAEAAEEKLKSRKKLTTDDILAMQRNEMNK